MAAPAVAPSRVSSSASAGRSSGPTCRPNETTSSTRCTRGSPWAGRTFVTVYLTPAACQRGMALAGDLVRSYRHASGATEDSTDHDEGRGNAEPHDQWADQERGDTSTHTSRDQDRVRRRPGRQ